MRYLFGFLCVCALGVMPLAGCSETAGTGGSGGTGGQDGQECESDVSDCTVTACVPLAELGVGGSGGMDTLGSGDTGGGETCENADECDDGEECTADSCADGTCEHVPVQDGTECYFEGVCVAGNCRALCDSAGAEGFCDNVSVADGTPCAGGICQSGACALSGTILPCTEQGIRNAIAAGGDEPYTFDCGGPKTVVTEAEIGIDNDVILDGEGNLTVDGDRSHAVFSVDEGSVVEFHAIAITGAGDGEERGIHNSGTLTLSNSTLFGNGGGGIQNHGTLTMTSVTISDNVCVTWCDGAGIFNYGALTVMNTTMSGNSALGGGGGIMNAGSGTADMVNSTVSGNTASAEGGGTSNEGVLTMTNCTVSENTSDESKGSVSNVGTMMLSATLIDGGCRGTITSNGYNIESPGNTCGFDQDTDKTGVTEEQLNLGPLADNGGPTMTHKPGDGGLRDGSDAIDWIPAEACLDADGKPLMTDQRGEPRPETGGTRCDVGSVEVQPAP